MEDKKKDGFFIKNRRYIKLTLCLCIAVITGIAFYRSSEGINLANSMSNLMGVLAPFIYGVGIAYILNSSVKFLEKKVYSNISFLAKKPTLIRGISISTAYFILVGFLVWIVSYLVPEIESSINEMTVYFSNFDVIFLYDLLTEYLPLDDELLYTISSHINDFVKGVVVALPTYVGKMLSSTIGIASIVMDIVIGIIVSIYILLDKEAMADRSERIIRALLDKKASNNTINFFRDANESFEKFLVGKIIDSAIIGLIFFAGALAIKAPFVPLISLIIGITNMIPFFGPFIGGVPVVILTLVFDIANPSKALLITIFILILQQFDGNILGPKILGDSVGVKPLGIIFAVMLFGSWFGAAGMFFGVPIFAVISSIFNKYIDTEYNKKMGSITKLDLDVLLDEDTGK